VFRFEVPSCVVARKFDLGRSLAALRAYHVFKAANVLGEGLAGEQDKAVFFFRSKLT
jgi:hypothetical protein